DKLIGLGLYREMKATSDASMVKE
ncbi:hypothetical protein A2U01_0061873, partial [Trifolium medium]|nr:hypothetical protein [Trifolium medium]